MGGVRGEGRSKEGGKGLRYQDRERRSAAVERRMAAVRTCRGWEEVEP